LSSAEALRARRESKSREGSFQLTMMNAIEMERCREDE
jgi:hypothetical protein